MHASSAVVLCAFAAIAAAASSGPNRMDRDNRSIEESKRQLPTVGEKPICVAVVPANTGDGSPGTAQAIKRDCSLLGVNATPVTAKNGTLAGVPVTKRQNAGIVVVDGSNNEVDIEKRTLLCAEFSGLNANNATILNMKRAAGCDHDINTTGGTFDNTIVKGPKAPSA
ncbi:hypothetical protein RQP46_005325 [Phenoliferia psychrophenolica]